MPLAGRVVLYYIMMDIKPALQQLSKLTQLTSLTLAVEIFPALPDNFAASDVLRTFDNLPNLRQFVHVLAPQDKFMLQAN